MHEEREEGGKEDLSALKGCSQVESPQCSAPLPARTCSNKMPLYLTLVDSLLRRVRQYGCVHHCVVQSHPMQLRDALHLRVCRNLRLLQIPLDVTVGVSRVGEQ